MTVEELQAGEHICRQDPEVIKQCAISGIPASEMRKVYCDPWTIGYDKRYGAATRMQQALMYTPAGVKARGDDYRTDLKPLHISQPEGVSFAMDGREISWQNWRFHVGFNYREGIVLHNIRFKDGPEVRPVFYRLSLAEMVVP